MSAPVSPPRRRSASPEELAQIHWLQRLAPEDRHWVSAEIQVLQLRAQEHLCQFGSLPTHWYGTLKGLLKLGNDRRDGLAITYAGLPTSGWFGEGTVIKLEPYRYTVSAIRASTVGCLPVGAFHRLLEGSLEFNQYLMAQINERLGQFMAARVTDRLRNPEIRVARSLLALFNPVLYPAVDPFFQITQQELSYLIGIPRQRINAALQQLVAKGAVELGYGGVRVIDAQRLGEIAAQRDSVPRGPQSESASMAR
jgi:CRP/FNR family cyclic AMP-dependent transcriptional regulator